jgi:hypothetical protein
MTSDAGGHRMLAACDRRMGRASCAGRARPPTRTCLRSQATGLAEVAVDLLLEQVSLDGC